MRRLAVVAALLVVVAVDWWDRHLTRRAMAAAADAALVRGPTRASSTASTGARRPNELRARAEKAGAT